MEYGAGTVRLHLLPFNLTMPLLRNQVQGQIGHNHHAAFRLSPKGRNILSFSW